MIGLTPDIIEVTPVSHGVLRLLFADGVAGEVDVLARMQGPVFDLARTQAGFSAAQLDVESGTVAWPGGADLAPDVLYERVRSGVWPQRSVTA
ncbi:MAG: hypothetical protein QOE31_1152 [Solirubrobacteraceae bacterium]|jgi:hypothetical protein|nr:hypothetical protein [Solirubrobacteraceae bacterium]